MVRSAGWVACAVVVIGCGGSKSGSATPDELAKAAVERAGQGDVDRIMELTGSPGIFDRAMECPADRKDAMRTKMAAGARDEITHDLAPWKGVTGSVTAVQPKGDPHVINAGKDVSGCKVKLDLTTQQFAVKVTAKGADGKEQTGDVKLTAIQVDGRWYLEDLGPPGGGDEAKLAKMKDAMCACKDAACVDAVQKDYADFMKALADKYKDENQPDEAMMKLGEDMAKCMSKAMTPPPTP